MMSTEAVNLIEERVFMHGLSGRKIAQGLKQQPHVVQTGGHFGVVWAVGGFFDLERAHVQRQSVEKCACGGWDDNQGGWGGGEGKARGVIYSQTG